MTIRAYPTLYIGGTPSQETGNSPLAVLLENHLYIHSGTIVSLKDFSLEFN